MSEEIKKVPVDIADGDLDEVAGGRSGEGVGGVDMGVRKKPGGELQSKPVVPKPPAKPGAGSLG